MSIKTRIAAVALAALTIAGSVATTTKPAEAHGSRIAWGVGAGLLGAAVVGSAIAASQPYPGYAYGYRRCGWVPQYDVYGRYVGTVRSCNYY